jgi:TPP-dependent pyruvate/acetoin dehydrogenase alpha subunit
MIIENAQLVAMYRALVGTRMVEEAITDLARRGVIAGHHSGLGHESIGVGVGMAMRSDDCVQMSHRSGMMLAHARGGYTLREAILSKFGYAPGCFGRLEGRPRTLEVVGLVGTWVPMAVGVAMADRFRGKDSVTVTFFGDGAANEGAVHEAMNLAGVQRLPSVFILENNGMAVSMRTSESTAAKDLASRAKGYRIPGLHVDGQDSIGVRQATMQAIARARMGDGPSLIEARITRWEPHAAGFADLRSEQELADARRRDGVGMLRELIADTEVQSLAQISDIDGGCREEVDAAVEEGITRGVYLPDPQPYSSADALEMVFAQ